ncbi:MULTISPECIES: helix-turn-helix domain-containing protein [Parafrankia]|uniref:helix-turn-helix domain-containing protein n=1 Tax=Parafrankia TaxID=2994362 RepID=UPI000B886472|nr:MULTISPECIES: helix-turn-helix transcriptional regulator [Parafrankia]MBE3202355.1 helix-turn-helix transcriptional regulator [Parafrankia sp. CH37]
MWATPASPSSTGCCSPSSASTSTDPAPDQRHANRRAGASHQRRGWSQAELAHAARMTQSTVARFEAGGTIPTLPVLERLAEALDADLDVRVVPRSAA